MHGIFRNTVWRAYYFYNHDHKQASKIHLRKWLSDTPAKKCTLSLCIFCDASDPLRCQAVFHIVHDLERVARNLGQGHAHVPGTPRKTALWPNMSFLFDPVLFERIDVAMLFVSDLNLVLLLSKSRKGIDRTRLNLFLGERAEIFF